MRNASQISLSGNARAAGMFTKAGVDLDRETGWVPNLAVGKPVTASFTAVSPDVRATAPGFAVDGFTISGLPIQQGTYLARNTIWGTQGSPNAQDWLEVDLGAPSTFDTAKLYFFSDKNYMTQSNGSGNTYRPPSSFVIQAFDGSGWRDLASVTAPLPNLNTVTFAPVTAQRIRVLVDNVPGYGTGLKEIQVFDALTCDSVVAGTHTGPLRVATGTTCLAPGARVAGPVTVGPGAGLIASAASITGPVSASGARTVQLLNSSVTGPVSIDSGFGRVAVIGSHITGPLRLTNNRTGDTPIEVSANTIAGPLTCTANQPTPTDSGLPNTPPPPPTPSPCPPPR
jgi:hypothetical protein